MMADATTAGDVMRGESSPADEDAKQSRLLDEIEAADRLPDAVWPAMMATYARLRNDHHGGDLSWLATRYLQAVKVRGRSMFARNASQLTLDGPPADVIACLCGGDAPVEAEHNLGHRTAKSARCPECGCHLSAVSDHPD